MQVGNAHDALKRLGSNSLVPPELVPIEYAGKGGSARTSQFIRDRATLPNTASCLVRTADIRAVHSSQVRNAQMHDAG